MRVARTRALNISHEGMAVQLPAAAMPLMIRFHSEQFKVKGVGEVRYCRHEDGRYIVGLEFRGGLRWLSPKINVLEPLPICDPECPS